MSTRRGGLLPPPVVVAGDPGPWSIVSVLRGAQASQVMGGGRRRPQPPSGLLLTASPSIPGIDLVGLGSGQQPAGGGPIRIVSAAREPALTLSVSADGGTLSGVSPYVERTWLLPSLEPRPEVRPPENPALGLPDLVAQGAILEAVADAPKSPDGSLAAVGVKHQYGAALALVRVADGGLVRWVVGARCAAWTPDGGSIAIGGDHGVLLAVSA